MDFNFKIKNYTFRIRSDPTTRNKYYCVMQNPFKTTHDTKVLYGGSVDIVKRKVERQYKKFKEKYDAD